MAALDRQLEEERRAVVFAWLDEQLAQYGESLPFSVLEQGAELRGKRQPVMHQQKGIYQPAGSPLALTIRSSLSDPYDDQFDPIDNTLVYGMEEGGPDSRGNQAVSAASQHAMPLVYLRQVGRRSTPRFLVIHPVWVVSVDRANKTFRVETSEAASLRIDGASLSGDFRTRIERSYATRRIKARLHQASFRESVLQAYGSKCAMCRLRERALLEAAHIVPDSEGDGEPVVPNGLALCRIHHGAFDAHLLSIHPERLEVRVRPRLLAERDGPMLKHGIQGLEGIEIHRPSRSVDQPDPARLLRHWTRFEALAV